MLMSNLLNFRLNKYASQSVAIIAFLLSPLPFSVAAQTGTTANDRWRVHGWLEGNDIEAECTWMRRDHTIKGYCTTEQGTTEVTGQSNGTTLTWSYEADIGGTPTTLRYNGVSSGRRMTGKIGVSDNPNAGAFKAEMVR